MPTDRDAKGNWRGAGTNGAGRTELTRKRANRGIGERLPMHAENNRDETGMAGGVAKISKSFLQPNQLRTFRLVGLQIFAIDLTRAATSAHQVDIWGDSKNKNE